MSELVKTQNEFHRILDLILVSDSFESARLAAQASRLAKRISELSSHPEVKPEKEHAASAEVSKS